MRIIGAVCLSLILTGCQTNQQMLEKMLALGDSVVYQKVEQGHFQETLYRAAYYSGIDIEFQIFNQYQGEFSPLTGIALQDQHVNNFLYFKYLVDSDQPQVVVELREGAEVTFSETVSLSAPVTHMHASWDDNDTVSLQAGEFKKKLSLPFKAEYIVNFSSSLEIVKKVNLNERR